MSSVHRAPKHVKRNIRLTPTDLEVLREVARHGFRSYPALRSTALKEYHRVYSWRLMKRLVSAGHLIEVPADGGGILGWSMSKKTRRQLSSFSSDDAFPSTKGPTYRTSYKHDEQLRRIRDILESCKAIEKWIPEHVLKAKAAASYRYLHPDDRNEKLLSIPDALLHLRSGGVESKAAFELELTQKSRKRIYRKLEAYVTTDDFDFAFFVAGTKPLMTLLQEIYREVVATSWQVKLKTRRNGIYFGTSESIFTQGLHAQFVADHDTLSFAELTA